MTWNGVCEKNEELIFNAAIRWLEFKPENRRQFAERFDCLLFVIAVCILQSLEIGRSSDKSDFFEKEGSENCKNWRIIFLSDSA